MMRLDARPRTSRPRRSGWVISPDRSWWCGAGRGAARQEPVGPRREDRATVSRSWWRSSPSSWLLPGEVPPGPTDPDMVGMSLFTPRSTVCLSGGVAVCSRGPDGDISLPIIVLATDALRSVIASCGKEDAMRCPLCLSTRGQCIKPGRAPVLSSSSGAGRQTGGSSEHRSHLTPVVVAPITDSIGRSGGCISAMGPRIAASGAVRIGADPEPAFRIRADGRREVRVAGQTRHSLLKRERAFEFAKRLERLDVPNDVRSWGWENYEGWVVQDNGIASLTLDARQGVSTEEMLRRQRARDAEQRTARRMTSTTAAD